MSMSKDPVMVDPKHYKVEFENEKVRVLRITYGPGEKSPMHGHPNAVAVFLGDASAKFTYPDGKTESVDMKAGQAMWFPPVEHLPENTSTKPFELIFVELKK
jgi:quercetin dioxygenase-like cupin family protein